MGYIKTVHRNKKSYYYYCENRTRNGKRTQVVIRNATPEEIAVTRDKNRGSKDTALIICANPECDNQIKIPRSQKRRFNTTYPLRYNRFQMIYCSKECQQMHEKALGR